MEKPVTLDAPLTSLPGIGPQRAALFARLNVRTVGELLRLYPRAYETGRALFPSPRSRPARLPALRRPLLPRRARTAFPSPAAACSRSRNSPWPTTRAA